MLGRQCYSKRHAQAHRASRVRRSVCNATNVQSVDRIALSLGHNSIARQDHRLCAIGPIACTGEQKLHFTKKSRIESKTGIIRPTLLRAVSCTSDNGRVHVQIARTLNLVLLWKQRLWPPRKSLTEVVDRSLRLLGKKFIRGIVALLSLERKSPCSDAKVANLLSYVKDEYRSPVVSL